MAASAAIIIYTLVSLFIIGVLAYLLYMCRKTEKFCGTCQGIGRKVCPNLDLIHKMYNDGQLTEFTTSNQPTRPWEETVWDNFFTQEEKMQKRNSSK